MQQNSSFFSPFGSANSLTGRKLSVCECVCVTHTHHTHRQTEKERKTDRQTNRQTALCPIIYRYK